MVLSNQLVPSSSRSTARHSSAFPQTQPVASSSRLPALPISQFASIPSVPSPSRSIPALRSPFETKPGAPFTQVPELEQPIARTEAHKEKLVDYLGRHSFKIQPLPAYSQIIGGLVPGFDPKQKPTRRLQVVFVEMPQQRVDRLEAGAVLETFEAQAHVDIATWTILKKAIPRSVRKTSDQKNGMVSIQTGCLVSHYKFKPIQTKG